MSAPRPRRLALSLAAVACAGAVAVASATPAQTGHAAAKRVTPAGVDGVKLGKSYRQLRRQGLVGRIRQGCEAGGPSTRSAVLHAPLRGVVNFTRRSPRKVANVAVRAGAKARGVGIGAGMRAIKAAYPKAKVDHRTDEVFQLTLVKVPANGGGKLQFGVSTRTKKVTLIGVPLIAFCE